MGFLKAREEDATTNKYCTLAESAALKRIQSSKGQKKWNNYNFPRVVDRN